MQSIQISSKLIIHNIDEARRYNVEQFYSSFFNEYDETVRNLGLINIPVIPQEAVTGIVKKLNGIFAARIGAKVINATLITDNNHYRIPFESVNLLPISYKPGNEEKILSVLLISQPFDLIASFGLVLVLKASDAQPNEVISLSLNETISIYSIVEKA